MAQCHFYKLSLTVSVCKSFARILLAPDQTKQGRMHLASCYQPLHVSGLAFWIECLAWLYPHLLWLPANSGTACAI